MTPKPSDAATRRLRDVRMLVNLLGEGMLPWDEQSPNAIMVHVGGQGTPWFIGRAENFTDDGLMIGSAPLSMAEVVAKIDAEEARHADA